MTIGAEFALIAESPREGKPLALLIPGLDGTGLLYFRQVEALSRRYRVRQWNFGERADFELADLTRDLGLETSGEPARSILVVGESFGGLVALDYAMAFPERLRRLVLVNAFPYYRRRVRIHLARILCPLRSVKAVGDLVIWMSDRVLASEGIRSEDRERFRKIIRQVHPASWRRRIELVGEVDLRPRLSLVQVPTTLLASGRDKLVPSVKEARFMATRIPHAQVREFPEAGHSLLLTPDVSLADVALEFDPDAGLSAPQNACAGNSGGLKA